MRKAARKDGNHSLIVTALRKIGASVAILDDRDLPDLLVGHQGKTVLIELKDGSRKPSERRLRPGQQRFFDEWKGGTLVKAETLADAFKALGIEIQA